MKHIALYAALGVLALLSPMISELREASAQAKVAKKEIQARGWGSVKGTVTAKPGNKGPERADLQRVMQTHQDAAVCCAGKGEELEDPAWIVDPKTSGVKYVAIWLKAQPDQYFEIDEKDRERKDPVVIDQAHCAYLPHVVAVYSEYFDGTKIVPTGQTLVIKNSSNVAHSPNVVGDPLKDPVYCVGLPPTRDLVLRLHAQRLPVLISCGVHSWMTAKAFVFDHPYFAITDDQGKFEIARVPAGVELSVMSWHESVGYVEGGKEGKKTTFKVGPNTLNLQI